MTLEQWVSGVPECTKRDPIWRRNDYRLALYVADVGRSHVRRLAREPGMQAVANQLGLALGSISANIAEGYSRGSGLDRVRFYEYALGSARESREWYWLARDVLGDVVATEQRAALDSIVRLLLTAIPAERSERFRVSRRRGMDDGRAPSS